MNMMDGAFFLARSKRLLTIFSPSPTYLEVRTEAVKAKSVDAGHSVAKARANNVFPLPGGPNRRSPREGVRRPENSSGLETQKNKSSRPKRHTS